MRPRRDVTAVDRFWQNIKKTDGCWEWTGNKSKGYGRFYANGKHTLVHRFSYELLCREIPEGLVLDHLCRNPACVNPDHLEPVTNRENVIRGLINGQVQRNQCVHGHQYDETNTRLDARGHRVCRTCQCAYQAAARKRRAELFEPKRGEEE